MSKKITLIVLLIVAVIIAVVLVNYRTVLSMKPIATGKVSNTEILAIKDTMVNAFLIPSDDGYIMIDCGISEKSVKKSLSSLNVEPEEVKAVFLTHSDSDHIGALGLFEDAKIYIGKDEIKMLDGSTERNSRTFNQLPENISINNLVTLEDNEETEISGRKLRAVCAPGHTVGLIAINLDDEYLFVGDAMSVSHKIIDIHPFTMDEETALSSIERIKQEMESSELVITAHYGFYSPNALE